MSEQVARLKHKDYFRVVSKLRDEPEFHELNHIEAAKRLSEVLGIEVARQSVQRARADHDLPQPIHRPRRGSAASAEVRAFFYDAIEKLDGRVHRLETDVNAAREVVGNLGGKIDMGRRALNLAESLELKSDNYEMRLEKIEDQVVSLAGSLGRVLNAIREHTERDPEQAEVIVSEFIPRR